MKRREKGNESHFLFLQKICILFLNWKVKIKRIPSKKNFAFGAIEERKKMISKDLHEEKKNHTKKKT